MRFVARLILLQFLSLPIQAATWYVSNTATNGYALGSDSNDGQTSGTPFLTVARADASASAGDIINVNPSSIGYQETSGSLGYLVLDKPLTLQTDPALVNIGKAAVMPAIGADRPLQLAANGIVLQDLVIDANDTITLSQGVLLQDGAAALTTLRRCDFRNFPSAASFCISTSITNGNVLLDRCSAIGTNGVGSAVAFVSAPQGSVNGAVILFGCVVSGIGGVFAQSGVAAEPFTLNCDAAPDGTRNTFSNLSYCVTWGECAPGTSITVNNADLYNISAPFNGSGSSAPSLPSLNLGNLTVTNTAGDLVSISSGGNIGSLLISGLNYSSSSYVVNNSGIISGTQIQNSSFSGNGPVFYSANTNMQNVGIANCQFSSNTTAINMPQGGNGLNVQNCRFNNCTSIAITLSGPDANILIGNNTLTGSYGLLAFDGVFASNIWVYGNSIALTNAQTDPIAVIGSTGVEISSNRISSDSLAAHGIIVGTDGYYNSALNSGPSTSNNLGDTVFDTWIAQPWTMVGNSSFSSRGVASFSVSAKQVGSPAGTITGLLYSDSNGNPGSLLATSSVMVNASTLSSTNARSLEFWFDTPYVASYSTPYWIVLAYLGVVNGVDYVVLDSNTNGPPLSTSADGILWNASSTALIYNVYHGNFECVNPLVHDNYVACSTPSASLHCVFFGAVTGGQAYRNQVYGGGPMLAAKLVDGSKTPCLFYDNLVFEYSGDQEGLRDKGSRGVQFLQNTVVMNATRGMAVLLDNNFVDNSYNGHPSVNAVVKNNIFYAYSLPGSGTMYQLGEVGYISPTCVNPAIDYNLVFCRSGLTSFGIDVSNGATAVAYASWPDWQAAGYDVHGINADPMLSNPSNPISPADFAPSLSSPAVGVSADLSAIVPTDFFGSSNNIRRTIGAIQPSSLPTIDIINLATELNIGVNGVPGQTIIIQASTDLLNWRSLATNSLSASRWVYTNGASTGLSPQFYRAVLAR